jgi:hypothetical protein
MADIDVATLVEDIKMVLPDYNVITDAQITLVVNKLIARIGTDIKYYGEVACKALELIADLNMAKGATGDSDLKREKAGGVEYEYHVSASTGRTWEDFKESLTKICPVMYGYSIPFKKAMIVNSKKLGNPLSVESYHEGFDLPPSTF